MCVLNILEEQRFCRRALFVVPLPLDTDVNQATSLVLYE